jgi:hypothetical protein
MHRVDAELTAGLPTGPIAPDVAVGAVDHAVDVMWGWQPEGSTYEARAVVEFVASDADKRWLVGSARRPTAPSGAGDGRGADGHGQASDRVRDPGSRDLPSFTDSLERRLVDERGGRGDIAFVPLQQGALHRGDVGQARLRCAYATPRSRRGRG